MNTKTKLAGLARGFVQDKNLGEATRTKVETYFKSYSDAIAEAIDYAEKNGYEVDEDDVANQITFAYPGRPKKDGESKRATIALTKNGKPQRKSLTIVVTYLGGEKRQKPYELVTYIS